MVAVGLGGIWSDFERPGWTKFSVPAFASEYVPGVSDPSVFVGEIVEPLVGSDKDKGLKLKPVLRRWYVEAYTMAAHDIQVCADAKDPDEPRQMPDAEREHRFTRIQEGVVGLVIDGEPRTSNHLIDLAAAFPETGVVSYISWEMCGSRDQEIIGVKSEKIWKPDANGVVKECVETKVEDATFTSDLLLRYCLTRRGLALDVAKVCRFEARSLLIEAFFDALMRQPIPGYARVTRNQIKAADVHLWRVIAKECRKGITFDDQGASSFEAALRANLFDPQFRYTFMPLPASSSAGSSGSGSLAPQRGNHLEDENRELKRKLQRLQENTGGSRASKSKQRKGAGKGKDKDKGMTIQGKNKTHSNGEPLCFNFNLRGCPNAKAGQKCKHGWHICVEPRCSKPHALKDHA